MFANVLDCVVSATRDKYSAECASAASRSFCGNVWHGAEDCFNGVQRAVVEEDLVVKSINIPPEKVAELKKSSPRSPEFIALDTKPNGVPENDTHPLAIFYTAEEAELFYKWLTVSRHDEAFKTIDMRVRKDHREDVFNLWLQDYEQGKWFPSEFQE